MKKVLLLMAFALSFVFISCGDDKDEPVDDYDDRGQHRLRLMNDLQIQEI